VAAGAIAEKWLKEQYTTEIVTWVSSVGSIDIPPEEAVQFERDPPTRKDVDSLGVVRRLANGDMVDAANCVYSRKGSDICCVSNKWDRSVAVVEDGIATRCPHPRTAVRMAFRIEELREAGDSTGGILTSAIRRAPVGIGEPCFDKLEAELAKAMMSLPATKGFEIGDGFKGTRMTGSEHNDQYTRLSSGGLLCSSSNHAGGTLGGISSGPPIIFRIAINPVSSIGKPQQTCSFDGKMATLAVKGRHDPCVLPRAPPLVEGMAAMVVADMVLRQRARSGPVALSVLSDN